MLLDHDRCYEALRSRDPRFDGRFFTAVRTTGVYCRPICPSRTPKAANVDFYGHPAAAEDAGYRPCRRCRPEATPGSIDWQLGAGVVARALRLIDDGALDAADVPSLADRLHVGDRHLRRLFAEHLGTTPDAVARTRRAHLAKRLLEETDLSVAEIAFAAGFGSVRQCNDVVRSTFAASPTELRRQGRGGRAAAAGLTLTLPVRRPFDGGVLLDWFRARAVAGMETLDGDTYRRRIVVDGHPGEITVTPGAAAVRLGADLPTGTPLASVVARTRRLLDLDADPDAIDAHLAADPELAPLVAARPGIRVPGCWTGFEAAVRAVVGQQVSVAAARTLLGRIVAAHGTDGAFPDAPALVEADLEALGVIGRRADTVRRIARLVADADLDLDAATDPDELAARLLAVHGVGPWTASYVALRTGDPDAFPAGDLHLRRILGVRTDAAARGRAERWRPWRAYAAMHLWSRPMTAAAAPHPSRPRAGARR